nr:hypothetical protein [uncultured Mediterranean phage uvMED]BAR29903.1 hypothetical protein [uncultured Mediterranean phage uvMED]BAR29952.1 hypothetical protein [uncultured Mediterranean phage uvMED]
MTGSTIKGQIQREDLALFDGNTMTATRPNSSGGVQTGNRVGDAVDVKLIHGGSSNSASFQKAVDAMGTQNGSLLFTPETWSITANISVPSNVTLIVPAGCVFNIDSGVTITNAGILFRYHKTFTSGSGTFTQSGTDILQIAGQSDIYGLDTGSTNTYVITTQASFSQYVTGLTVRFEPTSTNTGAATLNVDNLGAKTLKPVGSSSDVPVGSIKSGGIYTAVFDATSDIFQVSDAIDLANIASSGDITLDAGGDIILDADGADISLKDGGTEFGKISNSSSDLIITASVADKDIKFAGTDGSSAITPLTIDMSENGKVIVADDLALQSDSAVLSMGADGDTTITHSADVGITLSAGSNDTTLQIDSSADDADPAPKLILNRTSASPADNDVGGRIEFNMENDNNQQFAAAQISATALDVSDTTEDSSLKIETIVGGSAMAGIIIKGATIAGSNDEDCSIDFEGSDVITFNPGGSEAMRVNSSQDLLVGCTTLGANGFSFDTSSGVLTHARASSSAATMVSYKNGGSAVGEIRTSTTATQFITSSDYRLKENVSGMTDGIVRVKQLKPSRFNFIADKDTTLDGFLAHEVSSIVPEAVSGTKDEMEDGNIKSQGIDQSKLVPLLTAALQEAITQIEALEIRVKNLEA